MPSRFLIHPNPVNPTTTIRFSLPEAASVTLDVFDMTGVRVRSLVQSATMAAAWHEIQWDGRNKGGAVAASGMYLCRLSAGGHVSTMKMLLMK